MNNILKYFNDWNYFEKGLIIFSSIIALVLKFMWGDTWLGFVTLWTGILCVLLVAKGKRMNYIFGIPNVILYGWIAFSSTQRFHGEVMLNWFYFLPVQFYGWYAWSKNSRDEARDNVIMRDMPAKLSVLVIFSSFMLVLVYGKFLQGLQYQVQPWIDSTSTIFSVIAMVLMVLRYSEQWILWIIVDVVSIIMWASVIFTKPEAASMVLMWSAYLVNAVYGYYNWKRMSVKILSIGAV